MGTKFSKGITAKEKLQQSSLAISAKLEDLERRVKLYTTHARASKAKGDKVHALAMLKIKASVEKRRGTLLDIQCKLVELQDNIEFAEVMSTVVHGMKEALKTMTFLMKGQDSEEVTNLMAQLDELNQNAGEIANVVGEPVDITPDLEEEFEKLQTDLSIEKLEKLPQAPSDSKILTQELETEAQQIDALLGQ